MQISQYILSVGCSALACTVARLMTAKDGAIGAVTKTVTGIVMTLAILQPLNLLDFSFFSSYLENFQEEAQQAAEEGDAMYTESLRAVILQQTEAYILDKAEALRLELSMQLELSTDPVPIPVGITLYADASPYAKLRLEEILIQDLGIPEEQIQWM